MKRLAPLFVLALYLAAQGSFLLHGDEIELGCDACPDAGPRLIEDCSDGDCDQPSHHHHRHAEHHPGNCRMCGVSGTGALEPAPLETLGQSVRRDEAPLKTLRQFSPSLRSAARAPPANA